MLNVCKEIKVLPSKLRVVKHVSTVLNNISYKIESRKASMLVCAGYHRKSIYMFVWIFDKETGVWLVILLNSGYLTHCVAIYEYSRIILEAAEEYTLKLSKFMMFICHREHVCKLQGT